VLPEGGASIAVLPAPARVLDAEQWAAQDLKPLMNQASKAKVPLQSLASGGASLEITEVVLGWGSRPEFEQVNCYFTVSGKLFAARLIYRKGDARAEEYRRTLHELIQSLRPLARQKLEHRG